MQSRVKLKNDIFINLKSQNDKKIFSENNILHIQSLLYFGGICKTSKFFGFLNNDDFIIQYQNIFKIKFNKKEIFDIFSEDIILRFQYELRKNRDLDSKIIIEDNGCIFETNQLTTYKNPSISLKLKVFEELKKKVISKNLEENDSFLVQSLIYFGGLGKVVKFFNLSSSKELILKSEKKFLIKFDKITLNSIFSKKIVVLIKNLAFNKKNIDIRKIIENKHYYENINLEESKTVKIWKNKNRKTPEPVIYIMSNMENGFVMPQLFKDASKKFNLTTQRIRSLVKEYNLPTSSPSKVIKLERKIKFNEKIRALEEVGFRYIEKTILLSSSGECYKLNSNFTVVKKEFFKRTNNFGATSFVASINSCQEYVHRLVAKEFCDNPNNYKYVLRIDGDYLNYNASNLKWVQYPAYKRVVDSINKTDNIGWLAFIIDNFVSGINITILSQIIAEKAKEEKFKQNNNNNCVSTIHLIISLYSQKNKNFHLFTIRKDLNNTVYLEKNNYKIFKKNKII